MATKNKKDIVTDLLANIYANTTRDIRAVMVRVPFSDLINSVSNNLTIAQLRLEDDSASHSLANIIDIGKQGIFFYDPADGASADDGACCIVVSSGKRYKRLINKTVDARWYGQSNYYFPSVATALSNVQTFTRFVGLEIAAILNGSLVIYWFKNGIADGDLVEKSPETKPIDFTVGDGGATTPADLATDFIDDRLLNRTIIGFFVDGRKIKVVISPAVVATANLYGVYDPPNKKLSLVNGSYNQDTDYSIMVK